MSEQSKIEQINEITGGNFDISGDPTPFRSDVVGRHVDVAGTFGERSHAGRISMTLRGVDLDQALSNWLAAARAIQAAFEDGPATEPAGDTDADAGVEE